LNFSFAIILVVFVNESQQCVYHSERHHLEALFDRCFFFLSQSSGEEFDSSLYQAIRHRWIEGFDIQAEYRVPISLDV
jgi:hypothetical protein